MSVVASVVLVLATVVYTYWLYQVLVAARGLAPMSAAAAARPTNKFAILIPAHNEETVVGALLDSLSAQC